MVVSCCAFGCANRFKKTSDVGFYCFPAFPRDRREMLIRACRRKKWIPSRNSRICDAHFVSGKPDSKRAHVDYVPTVFVYRAKAQATSDREKRSVNRTLREMNAPQEGLRNLEDVDDMDRKDEDGIDDGRDEDSRDENGRDKDGRDEDGRDEDGRGKDGRDEDGRDEDGRDEDGRDEDGRDEDGRDKDGRKEENGIDNGRDEDEDGRDKDGRDEDGRDEDGRDEDGRDEEEEDGGGKDNEDGRERDLTLPQTAVINQYVCAPVQHVPVPVVCYIPSKNSQNGQFAVSVIKGNDDATKFYTGLATWKLFEYLLVFLLETCPSMKPARSCSSSPGDQLLLVLMRLRLNLRVEDLGYRFGIKSSNISVIFQRWIDAMFTSLAFLIKWPSQETVRSNMPQIFKDLYPRTRCIIDCSEIFIERPTAYQAQAKTYSNYKKHNTVKFLIGITPNGAISFLSKCWGGRATDKHITQNSGFLNMVEHGDVVLADRGFDITDDLGVFGVRLEIPSFTKGKKQLSLQEVEYSKRLSKVRIHVERVIGLLKNKYSILQSTLPVTILKHKCDTDYDKILTVCAALVNLSPSVVPL